MFRLSSHPYSPLYDPELLPKEDCKGIIFLDADGTFVFSGASGPPNWEDNTDGLVQFRYRTESDSYKPPLTERYQAYFSQLPAKTKAADPNSDMHVFKIKRNAASFFVALFRPQGTQLNFSEKMIVQAYDIIIPEPELLLLTGHVLIFNDFLLELGTQRLVLDTKRSHEVHIGLTRLQRALNALFRDERLFLRDYVTNAVIEQQALDQARARKIDVQANHNTEADKRPLCQLVGECAHENFTKVPLRILVDDNDSYSSFGRSKRNVFRHVKRSEGVTSAVVHAIAAAEISHDAVNTALATIETHSPELHTVIKKYKAVLGKLLLSAQRKEITYNLFTTEHNLGRVYAISVSETKALMLHRDRKQDKASVLHIMDLCKNPHKEVKITGAKYFASTLFDDEFFLLAGRDTTQKATARLDIIDGNGVLKNTKAFPGEHTIIAASACRHEAGQSVIMVTNTHQRDRGINLAIFYYQTGRLTYLTVAYNCGLLAHEDANNKNRFAFDIWNREQQETFKPFHVCYVSNDPVAPVSIFAATNQWEHWEIIAMQQKTQLAKVTKETLITHVAAKFVADKLLMVHAFATGVSVIVFELKAAKPQQYVETASFVIDIPQQYTELSSLKISDAGQLAMIFIDPLSKSYAVFYYDLLNAQKIIFRESYQTAGIMDSSCFVELAGVQWLITPDEKTYRIISCQP